MQMFEEDETSKTFKQAEQKVLKEEGGGCKWGLVQPWAPPPPLASVTSSLAPEFNPPKYSLHHLHQAGRGNMHQSAKINTLHVELTYTTWLGWQS